MRRTFSLRPIPTLAALVLPVALHAAVIPYDNDFSGTGSNTALPNTSGSWSLSGGKYSNSMGSGTNLTSTASINFTNADNTSFTLSTQFSITSLATLPSNQSFTVGLGAFESSSGFSTATGQSFYLADFAYTGQGTANPARGTLRLLSLGDANPDFTPGSASAIEGGSSAPLAISLDTVYTLRLTGTLGVGGALTFTLGLYDSTGVTQIGASATASDLTPLTGDYFGFRNRDSGNVTTGTTTIAFENFSMNTVPEPSSGLLLSVGLVALGARRRSARRQA